MKKLVKRVRNNQQQGQALVEFALMAIVLLMMLFLIIEASRVLWGWVTIQNAVREGARYAITGRFEVDCPIDANVKYYGNYCVGTSYDEGAEKRVASIMQEVHTSLDTLPLDEAAVDYGAEDFYVIEVWGVNTGVNPPVIQQDFPGTPGNPVIVRAVYYVPVITPFFRPIIETIPVYGQVVLNNENFGQLGSQSTNQGLPPDIPGPIPTVGPSPTPTPSPTNTPTNTPGPSPTPTLTPTVTFTATPDGCPVQFEGEAIAGRTTVAVTGDVGTTVEIINLSTGLSMGVDIPVTVGGHACPGFADYSGDDALNTPLQTGDVLVAQSSDGSFDTIIVQAQPSTPTFTPTPTETPTATPLPSPTITPTVTPTGPYLQLLPDCGQLSSGSPSTLSFNVIGINFPSNDSVAIYWDSTQFQFNIATSPEGFFSTRLTMSAGQVPDDRDYEVVAIPSSTNTPYSITYQVPCDDPPTPVPTIAPTNTPAPADLIVVGPPELISTRPITAYEPVQFQVVISNTGTTDVNNLFFVDIFFNPTVVITSGTTAISTSLSSGYLAVGSLGGQQSRVITVTAPLGFPNEPDTHMIYGMVDSVEQVDEEIETNNISEVATVGSIIQGTPPTATPTPDQTGSDSIAGIVNIRITDWVPVRRVQVRLINQASGTPAGTTESDANGYFEFNNVPPGNYTVLACFEVDGIEYSGSRVDVQPGNLYASIYMLSQACPNS